LVFQLFRNSTPVWRMEEDLYHILEWVARPGDKRCYGKLGRTTWKGGLLFVQDPVLREVVAKANFLIYA
jgi:hypothetical protein